MAQSPRENKSFWEDDSSENINGLISFRKLPSPKTRKGRAVIYSLLYLLVLICFLIFAITVMFDLRQMRGVFRWLLIISGLIFSFIPRFYWWNISYIFEQWLKNKQDQKEIEEQKRAFSVHKEFALSLWLAALAVFGVLVTQGTFYPETNFNPSYRGEKRYFSCDIGKEFYYKNSVLKGEPILLTSNEIKLTGLLGEGIAEIDSPNEGWVKTKNLKIQKPNCSN